VNLRYVNIIEKINTSILNYGDFMELVPVDYGDSCLKSSGGWILSKLIMYVNPASLFTAGVADYSFWKILLNFVEELVHLSVHVV